MKTALLSTMLLLFTFLGKAADQPNIIVILVDDAGYADWGFQGSTTILSPNIDAMVADGMNFTQGYVSNSVCAPSRAGLISGQYQNRFGFEYNIVKHSPPPGHTNGDVGLKTGIPTIANYLQDLGYKTGAFGKWHLGENINKYHPNNRGFDYFYGLLGGSRSYHQSETASDKKLMRNFNYAEPTGNFYITDILTDDFLNFMDTAANENKPFFAYLSYTAPHGPYHARSADKVPFQGMGLSGDRLEYHGMVYNLDNNVGRIIDKLKDEGKYDNTLIIFLSDNGGTGPALNTPLRGKKSQQYEGGLRVPFTMTWPNKVPAGSTYDQQVISLDIAPTVIEAAGGDMTICRDFDGKSLLPLAYDTNKTIHDVLFWRKLDQWEVVSDGVNKVIINSNDWGEADNDTIAFNLNANLMEDNAGDIYSNTSTTLTNLLSAHANWKTELTLPDWIGENVLKKICPNANTASECTKLVNRYNAFTEPSVSGCTYMPGYYVSSTEGDDTNDGSSPDSPWQTLARLNSATLAPGDQVYFKAGDTFIGQLVVDHSGTAGNPIVFGRYGTGAKPILDGANEAGGAHLAAVLVENQEYIEFKGLHITNDRVTPRVNVPDGQGYGIYVHNTGTQVMHHFRFTDMTFDGVYAVSTAGQDHDALKTAGIYIRSEKNTVTGEEKHVRDVVVQDCYFTNIAKFGFWSQHAGGSTGIGNDSINRNMDFVFRKNHFYKTGGSGITPGRTYNCLLEENLIEYPGSDMDPRMAKRGSGAWFFNCRNVVAQYNTVKHARGDGDTYGIHTDMSNQHVIVQYNYSEDTFGGFVEVLGNNDYITYRYNISVNDGLRQVKGNTLWVSDYHPQKIRSNNVYIYNNSVYLHKKPNGNYMNPGLYFKSENVYVYNNAFFADGGASMGIKEYSVNTASGTDVYVDNNLFQGNVKTAFLNRDANKVTGNPLYAEPDALYAEGYKLLENSPALNAGKNFTEPPFPMAGTGIFAHISAQTTEDYFGNPVDLASGNVHIGAFNGTPLEANLQQNIGVFEAEEATLSGNAVVASCNNASNNGLVNNLTGGASNAVAFNTIVVDNAGNYQMDISYMSNAARTISYQVNGGAVQTVGVQSSGSWCYQGGSPADTTVTIALNQGVNSIVVFDAKILDRINIYQLFQDMSLEAEDATLTGTAQTASCSQASNGQMVKQVSGGSGNAIEFSGINIPTAGTFDLVFSYYSASSRNLSYQINNGTVQTISVPSSGNWCYQGGNPADHTVSVSLSSGLNTITVFDAGVLDRIQIKESSIPPFQDVSLEAENATLSGTAQTASCSQASNGQMVKQLANGSGNAVEFSGIDIPTAGAYDLVFSYYSATARSISYQLNGGTTQTISVGSSGDWCYQGGAPGDHTISVNLMAGLNTIKVFDAGILDRIQIKETNTAPLTARVPDEPIVESSSFESVLYPNPLRPNSVFNVQMQGGPEANSMVTLYDLQGVKVLERTYAKHGGTMQVPTGSLAKGLYIVHVRTSGQPDQKFKLVVR